MASIVDQTHDLPHIHNFTDVDPLRTEPDVEGVVLRTAAKLDTSLDAVIIPGSKSVVADLEALRRLGIDRAITAAIAAGATAVGICGGFQMLGETIDDPEAVESTRRSVRGLGLLPLRTTMAGAKTLRLREATHLPSALRVRGYVIHHGRTTGPAVPVVVTDDGEIVGASDEGGRVWGTDLHGIFDDDAFRRRFVDGLRQTRGLGPREGSGTAFDIDAALDRLADVVASSVDMDAVYRIIDEGVR